MQAKPSKVIKEETYTILGKVAELSAKSGVSFELNGTWYKSEYMETRVIPEEANAQLERDDLWNTVNTEIDRQVDEVYKTLKSGLNN